MTTDTTAAGRLRSRWTDLATLGLGMAALGPALLLIASLAWNLDTEGEVGFFGIAIGIAVVGAALLRRFGSWAKALGILAALLIGMALFWTAFGLFAGPKSFFDFVPGLLVVPGILIAMGSCIAAIVAKRRGRVGQAASGNERSAIRAIVVVVALAAVVSGALTYASRSTVSDVDAGRAAARSIMKDFDFNPVAYTVAGGSSVLVRNDDPFAHTFTVDALGIDVSLTVGSSKLIAIPARPGTYVLYCSLHTGNKEKPKENDMAGTLTVT